MRRFLIRASRLVAVSTAGSLLVAAGLIMLVTPGPGLLAIIAGLAVLSIEFDWAERLRRHLAARARDARDRVTGRASDMAAGDGAPAPGTREDERTAA